MAQVSTRKLLEGPGKVVLHVWLESDGGGDLTDFELLSPADLVPAQPEAPTLRILEAWYSFEGFDVRLKFGGLVPRPIWSLPEVASGHFDFRHLGGLADYQADPPADDDGKILISTRGFTTSGQSGSIILEIRK